MPSRSKHHENTDRPFSRPAHRRPRRAAHECELQLRHTADNVPADTTDADTTDAGGKRATSASLHERRQRGRSHGHLHRRGPRRDGEARLRRPALRGDGPHPHRRHAQRERNRHRPGRRVAAARRRHLPRPRRRERGVECRQRPAHRHQRQRPRDGGHGVSKHRGHCARHLPRQHRHARPHRGECEPRQLRRLRDRRPLAGAILRTAIQPGSGAAGRSRWQYYRVEIAKP